MADQRIKPAKGMALVRFLEDSPAPNTPGSPNSPPSVKQQAVLAEVVAVGREVDAKIGDTVLVRPYAMYESLKFSDMDVIDGYAIVGVVT